MLNEIKKINPAWLPSRVSRMTRGMGLALGLSASALVASPAGAADMRLLADKDLTTIIISGSFDNNDSVQFNRIAASVSGPVLVSLDSPGGALIEGLIIGETIHAKGFATAVDANTVCASTCGLVWLAGQMRFSGATARIGFHAAYTRDGGGVKESGMGNALIGAYLTRLGLAYDAIMFITKSAPDDVVWLTVEDARRLGINAVWVPIREAAANGTNYLRNTNPSAMARSISPAQQASMGTTGYAEGRQARIDYEQWFAALSMGEFRDGALFWAANRSLKVPPSCDRPWQTTAWRNGCAAGQTMLRVADIRRKTDKDFWWGWNSF